MKITLYENLLPAELTDAQSKALAIVNDKLSKQKTFYVCNKANIPVAEEDITYLNTAIEDRLQTVPKNNYGTFLKLSIEILISFEEQEAIQNILQYRWLFNANRKLGFNVDFKIILDEISIPTLILNICEGKTPTLFYTEQN